MAKVVSVQRGPIHSSEVPDWDHEEDGFGLPYEEGYVVYATVMDERGVIEPSQLIFQDFDDARKLVKHFTKQVKPIKWKDNY
jgi:hypothetical protein